MPLTLDSLIYLVFVALFWGATNPFIKKGSVGVDNIKASTALGRFINQIIYLFTNFEYLIPFLINQCGSLVYVATLGNTDLSLAVPVANSLTFVFTGITGWLLGEEKPNRNTCIGTVLILAGTTLCCLDKFNDNHEITA